MQPPTVHINESVPIINLEEQFFHSPPFPQPTHAPQTEFATPPPVYNQTAATTKPRAKAKAKGKQVAVSPDASDGLPHRSSNYTVEEDLCLISGWLNNSMEPTVGTNQTYESFWDCVTNYYEQHKPSYSSQSKKSLQHRWDSINTAISKFVGIKAQQDRLKKSGETENDRLEKSIAIFEAGKEK